MGGGDVSKGTRFTESQLRKRGYCKDANGQWSRRDSETGNTEPSTTKCKPSARRKKKRSPSTKKVREKEDMAGYRFRLLIYTWRTTYIDYSNVFAKAIEDTIVKAGLIPDDSPYYCDQPLYFQMKVGAGQERTEIKLIKYKHDILNT